MQMTLMDFENQLIMNLGETYIVTGDGSERPGKQNQIQLFWSTYAMIYIVSITINNWYKKFLDTAT